MPERREQGETVCELPSTNELRPNSESATPLLDKVTTPDQLRRLSREQLPILCQELRTDLVNIVSEIGGHFASSLGVVELTVALHYIFNTPHDRLVWDTGHQGYIHKILTGRRKQLRTIRQSGGISGFLKREENEYDAFGAGHAGTSISAATGFAEAAALAGEDRRVIAIIGDGSMTSGMAFEALNHAGQLHRRLIVILNDNEMSIAPNVGALSWGFSKAISGPFSNFARRRFKSLHERGIIPHTVYRAVDKAEEAAQGFLSTPSMLFGSFDFRYLGPIDGHNIEQVLDALERAKEQDGPVLIHALTMKGKGYDPAEADPVKYHGVTPFCAANGEFPKKAPTPTKSLTQVFGETMVEICAQNPKVLAITAAMPDGTGLKLLAKERPNQFFDVGIAEQHAVTFAAGLACEGYRPFCAIYSTFLQRAYDQVLHDVCIQNLPVVFVLDRAGLVGADGATHHGVFDFAFLRSIPNMIVMAPKDEVELRQMLLTAAEHTDGPIAIRYPRGEGLGLDLPTESPRLEIGKGEIALSLQKRGRPKVVILGIGNTVSFAQAAGEILHQDDNQSVTVINARFVKPLDNELILSVVEGASLIVTVEDHVVCGGFGSAVSELLTESGALNGIKLLRLGVPDDFIEHGTQAQLYHECGFDVPGIVDCVRREFLNRVQRNGKAPLQRTQSVARHIGD